jgi:hypothetical protein
MIEIEYEIVFKNNSMPVRVVGSYLEYLFGERIVCIRSEVPLVDVGVEIVPTKQGFVTSLAMFNMDEIIGVYACAYCSGGSDELERERESGTNPPAPTHDRPDPPPPPPTKKEPSQ